MGSPLFACRDHPPFPPPPAVSPSRSRSIFRDFGFSGISGRETLHSDFIRNARLGTGSSTTWGPGPSVGSNFLSAWLVGLGPRELAPGARRVALFANPMGCIEFSHDFRKYGRNLLVPSSASHSNTYLFEFLAMLWEWKK